MSERGDSSWKLLFGALSLFILLPSFSSAVAVSDSPELSFSEVTVEKGGVGEVFLTLDSIKGNGIAAGQIEVRFNPSIVKVSDVDTSSSDFKNIFTNFDNSEGWLRLTWAQVTAPQVSKTSLAEITLRGVEVGTFLFEENEEFSDIYDEGGDVVLHEYHSGSVAVVEDGSPNADAD